MMESKAAPLILSCGKKPVLPRSGGQAGRGKEFSPSVKQVVPYEKKRTGAAGAARKGRQHEAGLLVSGFCPRYQP